MSGLHGYKIVEIVGVPEGSGQFQTPGKPSGADLSSHQPHLHATQTKVTVPMQGLGGDSNLLFPKVVLTNDKTALVFLLFNVLKKGH